MTPAAFREMLKDKVRQLGTQTKAAEAWGISQQYLHDILNGNRNPNDTVLSSVGYERIVTTVYRKKKP